MVAAILENSFDVAMFPMYISTAEKESQFDNLATGNLREGKQFSNFVCFSRFAGTALIQLFSDSCRLK
jgi:hypothetical protein